VTRAISQISHGVLGLTGDLTNFVLSLTGDLTDFILCLASHVTDATRRFLAARLVR